MPQVRFARHAQADLRRLHDFLVVKNPGAATRARTAIVEAIRLLETQPEIGRPVEDGFRELVIRFGHRGYLARYRYDEKAGIALVAAIRHQLEAGYGEEA
jgi:plasmid stabilization system protein ParE